MRPMYASLASSYPSRQSVPAAALFEEIGWDAPSPGQREDDTGAMRVSVALLRAGARIPGRVNVSRGRFKGQRIEPLQTRLALLLTHPSLLGRPEIYQSGALAEAGIGQRRGVVSYWSCGPAARSEGHIELLAPDGAGPPGCGAVCYREAAQVWFWPLR